MNYVNDLKPKDGRDDDLRALFIYYAANLHVK